MPNLELFIGETENKGRGMFTKNAIKAETVIETSPVIVMSAEDRTHLDHTLLHDYIFEWHPNGENWCCMALGCIPLYNHSYASNCEYFMDYDNQTMYIQAIRDIEPEEELTINYSGTWNDERKVWFDVEP
jgi:uncharacterized protein